MSKGERDLGSDLEESYLKALEIELIIGRFSMGYYVGRFPISGRYYVKHNDEIVFESGSCSEAVQWAIDHSPSVKVRGDKLTSVTKIRT